MAFSASQIDSALSAAWDKSIARADDAVSKLNGLTETAAYGPGGFSPTSIPPVTYTKATGTAATIPTIIADAAGVDAAYTTAFNTFNTAFQAQVATFISTYFPTLGTTLPAGYVAKNYDTWLNNQITLGGTGLPAAVEQALFARGRDRLLAEAIRQEDDAMTLFQGRGFTMPPGVLSARLLEMQKSTQTAIGDLTRDVVVKNTELSVETTKFAVGKAIELQVHLVTALGAFLNAAAVVRSQTSAYMETFVAARRDLANVMATYHQADIKEAELTMDATKTVSTLTVQDRSAGRSESASYESSRASRLSAAISGLGNLASASASAMNTVASASGQASA